MMVFLVTSEMVIGDLSKWLIQIDVSVHNVIEYIKYRVCQDAVILSPSSVAISYTQLLLGD